MVVWADETAACGWCGGIEETRLVRVLARSARESSCSAVDTGSGSGRTWSGAVRRAHHFSPSTGWAVADLVALRTHAGQLATKVPPVQHPSVSVPRSVSTCSKAHAQRPHHSRDVVDLMWAVVYVEMHSVPLLLRILGIGFYKWVITDSRFVVSYGAVPHTTHERACPHTTDSPRIHSQSISRPDPRWVCPGMPLRFGARVVQRGRH